MRKYVNSFEANAEFIFPVRKNIEIPSSIYFAKFCLQIKCCT